jgi:Flp pilus assembly protein TadD
MLRQAVQAVETAVQKEPYNPLFLKDAGILCRRVGLFSKAERYFEEALKWDQGNLEIETALAEVRQARAKK